MPNYTVNGTSYAWPEINEENWGEVVNNWASAVSSSTLQKTGGNFTLTAEVDLGATYGIKSAYLKSRGTNVGSTGIVRLANAESVVWRNAANGADLALKVNASDLLEFNGNPVFTLALGAANTVLKMNSGATAYEFGKIGDDNIATTLSWSKIDKTGSNLTDLTTKSHTALSDIGTNTHAQIDTHIANTSNPHSVTATQVGLGNVDNTSDATKNAASVTLTNKTIASPVLTTRADFSNQAVARFYEPTGAGSNFIGISAPDAVTADKTFKLPDGDGTANQVIKTDGSGNLGWATVAAGIGTNFDTNTVVDANYVILDADGYRNILMDTGASARTVTLPTASANTDRVIVVIKSNADAGIVTISGEAAELATSVVLVSALDSATFVCDGTNWLPVDIQVLPITATYTAAATTTISSGSSFTIQPGTYIVHTVVGISTAASVTGCYGGYSTDSGATSFSDYSVTGTAPNVVAMVCSATLDAASSTSVPKTLTVATTYYPKLKTYGAGATMRVTITFERVG